MSSPNIASNWPQLGTRIHKDADLRGRVIGTYDAEAFVGNCNPANPRDVISAITHLPD
jgi:hypothetical protein